VEQFRAGITMSWLAEMYQLPLATIEAVIRAAPEFQRKERPC